MQEDAEELQKLLLKFARNAETRFTDFSEDQVMEMKNIKVNFLEKGITVYLPNALFFKAGEAEINSLSKSVLNLLGDWVREKPYNIKIEGHTDNTKSNSTQFPSNWELSVTRAVNIMRYYIEKKIRSSKKISAFGYSEYQLFVPNDSAENKKKNRRMEVVFEKQNI
jgi:chemotaxis protein MotB